MWSMAGYTKLFSSIIGSTIWREDNDTRIVWITLLAMAGKDGIVEASVPGLADFARIPVEATRAALAKLMAPDPDSRTKDWEGRRIEEVDGGWRLLNHAKYRAKLSDIERREYKRQKQAEYRAVDNRGQSPQNVDTVDTSRSRVQKQDVPPNPLPGAIVAKRLTVEEVFGPAEPATDPTADLIGRIMDLWAKCWAEMRRGAVYKPHPVRDYAVFQELAENYGDNLPLLETMFQAWAAVDLGELPQWARSKSPRCFLKLAPEMDAQLRRPA